MEVMIIDTSVIVRYLTGDDAELYNKAEKIFSELQDRSIQLKLTGLVIAEVIFVLTSKNLYGMPRTVVCEALAPILDHPGVLLEKKEVWYKTLTLFQQNSLSLVDNYLLVLGQENHYKIATFDEKLLKATSKRN